MRSVCLFRVIPFPATPAINFCGPFGLSPCERVHMSLVFWVCVVCCLSGVNWPPRLLRRLIEPSRKCKSNIWNMKYLGRLFVSMKGGEDNHPLHMQQRNKYTVCSFLRYRTAWVLQHIISEGTISHSLINMN